MQKQTKIIITREWVEKELKFYNTADIRSTLVSGAAVSLLFLPIAIGFDYGFFIWIENAPLKIILPILTFAFFGCPIWIHICWLIKPLKERKLIKRGDFDIVIREVLYMEERTVRRNKWNYLYFSGFKEPTPVFPNDLVSAGDKFYVVYFKTTNKIAREYSTKMYEYKEL